MLIGPNSHAALRGLPPDEFPRMPPTAAQAIPWPNVDRENSRPGYRLTPDRLWSCLRRADMGSPASQCGIFEDVLEVDGHLQGLYRSRMEAVAHRPFVVAAGGEDAKSMEAADVMAAALEGANTEAMLWNLMDSIFYGYSATEPLWRFNVEAGAVVPYWFNVTPHRRFLVDEDDNLRLTSERNIYPGEVLRPEWLIGERPGRKRARAGIFRTTVWWCLFKRMSFRDWMIVAERFGIPFIIGQYKETASAASRAVLRQAIEEIGTHGQAVLSEATQIFIKEAQRSGDMTALHPTIVRMCNEEISKAVASATLMADSGSTGSYNQATVHATRAAALSFADALWCARMVGRSIMTPFVSPAWNPRFAGAKPPLLFVQVQPEMDPLTAAQVAKILHVDMRLPLDTTQLYHRFGWRKPSASTTLEPPPHATPASAKQPEPA